MLHTTGGYLLYAALTHHYVFDYHDGDIYWCTADVGWVTGHSYIVYGPLANGATTLMFEGVPNYPTTSRFWEVIDKHKVNIFYTAPTAIRALMREGDAPVKKTSRAVLAPAGQRGRADQSGSLALVSPRGGRRPLPHRRYLVADRNRRHSDLAPARRHRSEARLGHQAPARHRAAAGGCRRQGAGGRRQRQSRARRSWPGQMRSVYGDHQRFIDTYFKTYRGKYFTGDGCRRDEDGYYWITGRVDDVINVSGHRLGTAEVESALVGQHEVAEAAVVGYPARHQGPGHLCLCHPEGRAWQPADALNDELKQLVGEGDRPIAKPDVIQFAPGLPKTRSGKIMRRILRKIAEGDMTNLGDISTLADPSVVDDLVKNAREMSDG